MSDRVVHVWRSQPNDKHTWAFVYFCKRQGDSVRTRSNDDRTLDVWVRRLRSARSADHRCCALKTGSNFKIIHLPPSEELNGNVIRDVDSLRFGAPRPPRSESTHHISGRGVKRERSGGLGLGDR